jgi:hypothetical protein
VGQSVGSSAAGIRRNRHFVHNLCTPRVHPLQQNANHHGVRQRIVLCAAHRHSGLLPDDIRHPGQTNAGHVHHPQGRIGRVSHRLLQRNHHQDQSHLAHLQPRHSQHPEAVVHITWFAGHHLPW